MKKLLLLSFLSAISLLGLSQPSLTSGEMLGFGSVMEFKGIQNLTVIDTTIKGAGVTWDFSSIAPTSSTPVLTVTIVRPASTPYGGNFPSANYAYQEVPTAYRYFNLSSSKMERVGSRSGTVLKTYSDPQIEYVFPLQLGVSNLDTWDNDQSSFGGNYDLYCIGYGTLKLPNATYNNALMVRVDVEELFSFPVYFWYSSDNGAILLEYIVGDGFFVGESGQYLTSLTTTTLAVNVKNKFPYQLIYNNPVENVMRLNVKSGKYDLLNYTMITSLGDEVKKGSMQLTSADQTFDLDLSTLDQGIYFLSIKSGDSVETIKVVKN